jgi:hypothetical protein
MTTVSWFNLCQKSGASIRRFIFSVDCRSARLVFLSCSWLFNRFNISFTANIVCKILHEDVSYYRRTFISHTNERPNSRNGLLEGAENVFRKTWAWAGKLVALCTNSSPSMTGNNAGFVSLLKKHLKKSSLLSYHCIIHQGNLASRFDEDFRYAIKRAVHIVSCIRAGELSNRPFQEFLEEPSSCCGDVLCHSEVRWLDKGEVSDVKNFVMK